MLWPTALDIQNYIEQNIMPQAQNNETEVALKRLTNENPSQRLELLISEVCSILISSIVICIAWI